MLYCYAHRISTQISCLLGSNDYSSIRNLSTRSAIYVHCSGILDSTSTRSQYVATSSLLTVSSTVCTLHRWYDRLTVVSCMLLSPSLRMKRYLVSHMSYCCRILVNHHCHLVLGNVTTWFDMSQSCCTLRMLSSTSLYRYSSTTSCISAISM